MDEFSYVFGFDLDNIQRVMDYLTLRYEDGFDYHMFIERGEDVMNACTVNEVVMEDTFFQELIEDCEVIEVV